MAWPNNPRPARSITKLRLQINERWPNRSKMSDGLLGDARHQASTSDHNAWVKDGTVGVVTAIDVTHDPANGCDAGKLAEALADSEDKRIKYIIWNRQIASSYPAHGYEAWERRPYNGANPHTKHIHISVKADKELYDDDDEWEIEVTND